MKFFHDLIYKAGGYSSDALSNATETERREIRQLGLAVLFSVVASALIWSIAASVLFAHSNDYLIQWACMLLVGGVGALLAFHNNRALIVYFDTVGKQRASIALPLFRLVLIFAALVLCYQAFPKITGANESRLFVFILALIELYPLILKWQYGQTIAGRWESAKIHREHQRGQSKWQECDQVNDAHNTDNEHICPEWHAPVAERCATRLDIHREQCVRCEHYESARAVRL